MKKNKKVNSKVDISKLDPSFLDSIRSAGKEYQEKRMSLKEDSTNKVDAKNLSSMTDEQASAIRSTLVSKKTGANTLPAKDKQEQDKENEPIDDSEIDAEEQQMNEEELPDLKPEDRVKEGAFGMTNFKKAFSFFGPRLASLLIGGDTALETTDEMLRGYKREQGQGQLSPYEKIRLEQAQQRLNLTAAGEKGRGKRHEETMKFKQQEAKKIPAKFLGEVVGKSTVLNQINYVRELSEKVGKDLRGPFSSRARSTLVNLGFTKDEGFVKLRTASKDLLAKYVKSVTGAQMSDAEAERLMTVVASENDTYENFNAKLSTLQDIIAQEKAAILKALEEQGYSANLKPEQKKALVMQAIEQKLRASEKKYDEDKKDPREDLINKYID